MQWIWSIYDVLTLATIAGGLVVMKSNAPPLTPIPSLSIRNKGKFEFGSDIVSFRANFRIWDQSKAGIIGDKSAPVVVVPIDPLPTYICINNEIDDPCHS